MPEPCLFKYAGDQTKAPGPDHYYMLTATGRGTYESYEIDETEYMSRKASYYYNQYNIFVGGGTHVTGAAYNQQYYENNNRNTSLAAQNSGYNSKLVGKGAEAQGSGGLPWYSIYNWPGLGSSARTMDAINAGNYLSATAHFLTCAAEVFTFGYSSGISFGAKTVGAAAKGGTSGLKTFGSLTEKFGEGYKSIAVTQGKHLPIQLGQKLNTMSPGSWSKIYEAGMLNGSKVETHYFFNSTTGQYVNPFIKSSGWGRTFRGVTGY